MLHEVWIVLTGDDDTEHTYRLDLDHGDYRAGDRIVARVEGVRAEFNVTEASSLVLQRDGRDVRVWTLMVRLAG